ncbi:MAG: hypothetical protein CL450_06635 [Acidimicrobiaceae bacterium]|nr:hypothetical protein [Acidimicrobiaceae bacterium]|tara:strand:+ start:533 stop:892 length:360 start_codon:yes stop_codon:yes gene_type:complete
MECPRLPPHIRLEPHAKGYGVSESAGFQVPVVTTPEAIHTGLMHREDVGHGMLFAFQTPRTPSFWMKNTLVPLDMEFLDADFNIVDAHRNVQPGDLTLRTSRSPVCFVLERPAARESAD